MIGAAAGPGRDHEQRPGAVESRPGRAVSARVSSRASARAWAARAHPRRARRRRSRFRSPRPRTSSAQRRRSARRRCARPRRARRARRSRSAARRCQYSPLGTAVTIRDPSAWAPGRPVSRAMIQARLSVSHASTSRCRSAVRTAWANRPNVALASVPGPAARSRSASSSSTRSSDSGAGHGRPERSRRGARRSRAHRRRPGPIASLDRRAMPPRLP